MKKLEIFFGVVKVPLDFIMCVFGFIAAYQLRLLTEPLQGFAKPIDYTVLPTIYEYFQFSALAALTLIFIFATGNLYSLKSTNTFANETKKVIILWSIWAMAIISYFFLTRTFPFSRLAILYSWSLTLFFLILGRGAAKIIQNILLSYNIGRRRLIFIGNNKITRELHSQLANDTNYKIIGLVGTKPRSNTKKLKFLGSISNLSKIIKAHKVDEVIQTKSDLSDAQASKILETCDLHHIHYRFVPDLLEVRRTNIEIQTFGTLPVISLKPTPLDGWGKVIKRAFDITASAAALVFLSPIFILTAIAIKIDSRGPIFYTAPRIGQKAKIFQCHKFRSMQPNTHQMRYKELAKQDTRGKSPLVKIKNDPRVTRVGRFIRKYSIDELPQLINVLKGEMSLVGPRPHLPEEVEKYQKHHRFVLTIKPGLTGIPQTSGRSDLDFEQEVKLDRFYIEHWTIWMDLKVIVKTILVVLRGHQE